MVPHIDELRIDGIINFAKLFLQIESYFAESKTGYIFSREHLYLILVSGLSISLTFEFIVTKEI